MLECKKVEHCMYETRTDIRGPFPELVLRSIGGGISTYNKTGWNSDPPSTHFMRKLKIDIFDLNHLANCDRHNGPFCLACTHKVLCFIIQLLWFLHGFLLVFRSFFLELKNEKKFKNQEVPGFELGISHSAVESSLIKNVNKFHYLHFLITCWLQSGIQA